MHILCITADDTLKVQYMVCAWRQEQWVFVMTAQMLTELHKPNL